MSQPILIAGGGTGGHVNPAIAVADALVLRGHAREDIHFVGSSRGLEARLVPAAGYSITLLPGRGISRSFNVNNVRAVVGLAVALARALVLVARTKPSVVLSVGGYASAPCAVAAALLRVPLVLAESNAVPGASNRLVARVAKASAIAIPGTPLPRAVVTGNPVRPEIAAIDHTNETTRLLARDALGLPHDRVVVAVFGGSLGARSVNLAMADLIVRWKDRTDVAVHHVVGSRDWRQSSTIGSSPAGNDEQDSKVADGLVYRAVEYENQMDQLYAAADVLVCRAGATTVAEVAAVGVPAVFVPFPHATGDHQTANARALEHAGAAVVVPDDQCSGAKLESVLNPLVADPAGRRIMGLAAKALAVPDAAGQVAALLESHMRA